MKKLEGKIAVITGAGQGVGQGIAFALATDGAAIAVLGRTESKLKATCEEIVRRGGKAIPVSCDVNDKDSILQAVEASVRGLGGVDILVNNAYNGALGPLLSVSDEEFQQGFISAPYAAFRFMKACHPHMKARGGGVIVNLVTSAMVRWDASGYGPYAAAKQALRALTRAAASEWGVDGIRAINVAPHADSPALKGWIAARPEEAKAFFKTIPLGRIGECEADIGRGVAALVSQDLRYLTGATIPLDGGQAYFG
ncbi:MAG: SDR family oxidoreductase [Proteobacteria bacterium]|nr:SDR family oxidoreductase [Pseudomonadota bacterium]HQR03123.1 SDR family oxidoreductase [Rhodocyclaceae bacterium]